MGGAKKIRWDRMLVAVVAFVVMVAVTPTLVRYLVKPSYGESKQLSSLLALMVGPHIQDYPVVGELANHQRVSEYQMDVELSNGQTLKLIGPGLRVDKGVPVHHVVNQDDRVEGYCFNSGKSSYYDCYGIDTYPRSTTVF